MSKQKEKRICPVCQSKRERREVKTGEYAGKVQWRCKKCHSAASIKHRSAKKKSQEKRYATLIEHRLELLKDRSDLTECPGCNAMTRDATGHCLGRCGTYLPTPAEIEAATVDCLAERPRPAAIGPVAVDVTMHTTSDASWRRKAKGSDIRAS